MLSFGLKWSWTKIAFIAFLSRGRPCQFLGPYETPWQSSGHSCHSTSNRPLHSRYTIQTLWTCKLLGARHLRASRVWRPHGRQGTPRGECHIHDPRDWSLLRGDRSCDALSAKTWISRLPYGATSIFGSVRCCCRSRQPRLRWIPPHLFPSGRITNPSQFCCNQLCRASSPLAACGDPHCATGAFYGALCPDWTPWPFSPSTRSLHPRQRCRTHDLSERAF